MNKVIREKNNNYTTISNVFLQDRRLSLKSKGLLAVVMALPEDWDFSIAGITTILKEGKASIYNTINELKENGYCKVETQRSGDGLILGNNYTFYEEPHMENVNAENPYTENQDMDNRPQINTYSNKELNKLNTNRTKVSITSNAMSEQSSAAPVEKETIDFPMLIKFFNDTMDEHNCVIPRVKTISGTRKTAVNARLREHGKDAIMQVIIKASVSNFMNGANNHDWTATFDWMFKPNNFPKILEGNYDNKTTTDKGYISDSERAREQRYKEYEGVIAQFEEEQRQIENGTYPFSD